MAYIHKQIVMLVIKNNTKGPQNDINFLAQKIILNDNAFTLN